jgi:chromate transporter
MVIVVGLALLYERYASHPTVRQALVGLAAAASGLVVATALKIAAPLRTQPIGILVALVTLGAIAVARLPLPLVLVVVAPLSIALMYRDRERRP